MGNRYYNDNDESTVMDPDDAFDLNALVRDVESREIDSEEDCDAWNP